MRWMGSRGSNSGILNVAFYLSEADLIRKNLDF